jgi:leucyl-tRNA synthetase
MAVLREVVTAMVKLLAPLVPHMSEELWRRLGHETTVFKEHWPEYDEDIARAEDIEVVLQVNGKVRSHVTVPADTPEAELRKLALADERIAELTGEKEVRKVIVVPGRLVNVVVT